MMDGQAGMVWMMDGQAGMVWMMDGQAGMGQAGVDGVGSQLSTAGNY